MAAIVMDGRVLREKLLPEIRRYALDLREHHQCVPSLAVILVGSDAASRQYVKNKQKLAAELGFHSQTITMEAADCTTDRMLETVTRINRDSLPPASLFSCRCPMG